MQRKDETGPRLLVEVEDTGPGISAEELGKLFQSFEQASAGAREGGGTGLGLVISREFARLMGGDITVSSEVGKGSIFRLEIPLEEGQAESVEGRAELRTVVGLQPGQPMYRILIADDTEENRVLLSQMLNMVGFETRQATNGEEALQELGGWQPHLILMDIRMPVLDGYEAIRRLRTRTEGETIPIIAVSASAFQENRQEALKIGANDFIGKPFREAELFEKIRLLLGVCYVYADEAASEAEGQDMDAAEALTREALAIVPEELVTRMRAAALDADRELLLELISQVESHDAGVARALRVIAQRFDYESLLKVLETEGCE